MTIKLGQRLTIKAIHPFAKMGNKTREVVVTDIIVEGFLGTDNSGNVHFFDEFMIVGA
jgi:hypothetical protein